MTRAEVLKYYPNATESFIRRNLNSVCPVSNPKPQLAPERQDCVEDHPRKSEGQGRARVVIESRRARICDADNLYCKAILDAIRYAGLIADDSPEHIELTVRQTKVKKKDEETVVMIQRIPEISATEAAQIYSKTLTELKL